MRELVACVDETRREVAAVLLSAKSVEPKQRLAYLRKDPISIGTHSTHGRHTVNSSPGGVVQTACPCNGQGGRRTANAGCDAALNDARRRVGHR